ncbi:hypothetical protein [uncultured Lutibacter sp.]|nr:hypothetical protein [uncultured Lutibacter sp.]
MSGVKLFWQLNSESKYIFIII